MATKNDEIYVKFGVYDFDCTPEELTSKIGLEPSETFIKGDKREIGPLGKQVYANVLEHSWIINSKLKPTDDLQDHIEILLQILEAQTNNIREIAKNYYAEVSIAIYSYNLNVGMHIDHESLSKLAALHLEVDLDIYNMGE